MFMRIENFKLRARNKIALSYIIFTGKDLVKKHKFSKKSRVKVVIKSGRISGWAGYDFV